MSKLLVALNTPLVMKVFSDVKDEAFLRSGEVSSNVKAYYGPKYADIYEAIFIQLNGLPHKNPLSLLQMLEAPV